MEPLGRALVGLLLTGYVLGAPDNRGTEFIIGFMEHDISSPDTELFVTTSRTTTVNVRVSAPRYSKAKIDSQFTVTAGYVHSLKLSNSIEADGVEMSTKGVLVEADDEIIVYGSSQKILTGDSFLAYPTDVLGTEYYVASYYPSTKKNEFLIVGAEDGTKVEITFPCPHLGSSLEITSSTSTTTTTTQAPKVASKSSANKSSGKSSKSVSSKKSSGKSSKSVSSKKSSGKSSKSVSSKKSSGKSSKSVSSKSTSSKSSRSRRKRSRSSDSSSKSVASVSCPPSSRKNNIRIKYGKNYYESGDTLTVTMDKFDTLQIQANNADLTGTFIKSSKKVAVFSGVEGSYVAPYNSWDFLVEQLQPTDTWGKKFAIVPTPMRATAGDTLRFIASNAGSSVRIQCSNGYGNTFTIPSMGFVQLDIKSDGCCYVESKTGIQVVMFVKSQENKNEKTDPSMIVIPPIEQYAADYTFATPDKPKHRIDYTSFFTYVVKTSEKDGILLDDAPALKGKECLVPGTDLTAGFIDVLSCFAAFIYGGSVVH